MNKTILGVVAMAALAFGCSTPTADEAESPNVELDEGLDELITGAAWTDWSGLNGFGTAGRMEVTSYAPQFSHYDGVSAYVYAPASKIKGISGTGGTYWRAGTAILAVGGPSSCTYDHQCNTSADPYKYYCLKFPYGGGLGNPKVNTQQRESGGVCYEKVLDQHVVKGVRIPSTGNLTVGTTAYAPTGGGTVVVNPQMRGTFNWITMTVYTPIGVKSCPNGPGGSCCGDVSMSGYYGMKKFEDPAYCRRVISGLSTFSP